MEAFGEGRGGKGGVWQDLVIPWKKIYKNSDKYEGVFVNFISFFP